MKKLLLLFAAATLTIMTGCDPANHYYFNAINGTESDMIIEVGGSEPVAISPREEKMIYELSDVGNVGDYCSAEEKMSYLEVKINNMLIPNSIWRRKYWEYKHNDKYHASYVLTITDELIESLLSEEEL